MKNYFRLAWDWFLGFIVFKIVCDIYIRMYGEEKLLRELFGELEKRKEYEELF